MKTITLGEGEHILAVVPERCFGPGWSNQPVWVHVKTADGRVRSECIQPEERSIAMHHLFSVGATVCAELLAAVPTKKAKAKRAA